MKTCAREGCDELRVEGNRGQESYCRQHKNEMARAIRHAGKGPEVLTEVTCARAGCDEKFLVSNWGQAQRYHSTECRDGVPKEARAAIREQKKTQREAELASMTEKRCPGLPERNGYSAQECGVRPLDEFHRVKGRPDTLCKVHRREQQRRYEAQHREARRTAKRSNSMSHRLSGMTYDGRPMTIGDRERELAEDSLCRICTVAPATDADHDDATGRFRGMLCRSCNLRLHRSASVEWFRSAIAYLEAQQ